MMNGQFPLSLHSRLITISINKVRPTSVRDIIDHSHTIKRPVTPAYSGSFPNLSRSNSMGSLLR